MEFKRTFTETIPEDTEKKFKKMGVDRYHGNAKFLSENEIEAGSEILRGEKIFIASGAEPMKMGIEGEELLSASDEFLEMDQLPDQIIFIGGGFISFEFAHLAARGAEVHILHRSKQPLKQFDPDLVKLLMKRSEEIGIFLHLEVDVNRIEKDEGKLIVTGEKDGEERRWQANLAVHGAGRTAALNMDLEIGNIEQSKKGVKVNEYMQSVSNPSVYAAGDAAASGLPPLTPVASKESETAIGNLLEGNKRKIDSPAVPSVVFTVPKLASVGISERQAEDENLHVDIQQGDMTDWFTYRRTNQASAAYKVIVDRDKQIVLGAHFLGEESAELINLFTVAIQFEIPLSILKEMLFAYPTAASDISYMI